MGCDLTDVLATVERQGIRLKAAGGQLLASPKDAVSDDLRGLLRSHKAALIVRLECDGIVRDMLDKVNRRCPHDWQPSPDEWCRLDEIQLRIDAARDRGDVAAVERLCAGYAAEADRMFGRWHGTG